MSEWILASEKLPESLPNTWSEPVIALMLSGDILKLSCMGEYWQRPAAMEDCDKVLAWMPIPPMPD